MGGHIPSAIAGVTALQILPNQLRQASPLVVATTIALMQYTCTLHLPSRATALIAVIGGENIHQLGYIYALFPVATGAFLILFIALGVNKVAQGRTYQKKIKDRYALRSLASGFLKLGSHRCPLAKIRGYNRGGFLSSHA